MSKATKLPSGSWRCLASKGTGSERVRKSFTASSKKEAERLAAIWEAEEEEPEQPKNTLEQAMETYIESCRCSGASPSTIKGYTTAKKNGFPSLMQTDITQITTQDVQTCINEMSGRLSPKTIRNYLGFLSVVLNQYDGVVLKTSKLKIPKKQQHEMEIPTTAQIQQMLKCTENQNDLFLCILLASTMGLRLSEICALTWSKVINSEAQKCLIIDSARVPDEKNVYHIKGTKTEAGNRTLPIPDSVYKELMKRRNLCEFIIQKKPCAITSAYIKLTDKLHVPGRFHDLRHYHASQMLAVGAPEKYICADMGHSTFEMVRRVYGHVMEDKQQKINREMESLTDKMVHEMVHMA